MAADKYLGLVSGVPTNTSAVQAGGGANAGKIVALNDTTGLLDASMIPGGITALPFTVSALAASGGLTAGNLVYLSKVGSDLIATKASNTAANTLAQGYVLTSPSGAGAVTVYLDGFNTSATITTTDWGVMQYLSTAGGLTTTPPSGGDYIQPVGFGVSDTSLAFHPMLAVKS